MYTCERWSIWSDDFEKVYIIYCFLFTLYFLWTLNVSSLCNLLLPRQSIVIFLYKIVLHCLWSNHYYHGKSALIWSLMGILCCSATFKMSIPSALVPSQFVICYFWLARSAVGMVMLRVLWQHLISNQVVRFARTVMWRCL